MSDASQVQPGAPQLAESPEFDFGPFKKEVVRLWSDVLRLKSGNYEVVEANRPAIEAKYDEIIRLSAEALIASGGEIVEPHNILKASESKGVFKALHEAFSEASKANPMYCMPAQAQELNFTQRIAAEAVKILLARQRTSEHPAEAPSPEVAAVVAATREGAEGA